MSTKMGPRSGSCHILRSRANDGVACGGVVREFASKSRLSEGPGGVGVFVILLQTWSNGSRQPASCPVDTASETD